MDDIKEELAYLIGKITGDGNLDKVFTCRFIGQEEDLIKLSNLIYSKFNIPQKSLKIRIKKNSYGVAHLLQVNNARLGRELHKYGAPQGNKTLNKFLAPKWIFSKNIYKKRYLQALFEDELTTIKIKKCNYANCPDFKQHKNLGNLNNLKEFLEQLKQMLTDFGIETSHINETKYTNKRKDGIITKGCYFWIQRNKQNILRFQDKVGFRLCDRKINSLNECCNIIEKSLNNNFINKSLKT